MELVDLSNADRAVLMGRERWLGRIMGYGYLLLACVLLLFVVKDALVYREFKLSNTKDVLWGGVLFGGSIAAAHAILTLYERKLGKVLRADVTAGKKARARGILVSVQEGSENEPTRFTLSTSPDSKPEEFLLSSLLDLIRIQPLRLVGKKVEIEYAPISRVVLRLAESAGNSPV